MGLLEDLAARVDALAQEVTTLRSSSGWLDTEGAARHLATTKEAVQTAAKRRKIPCYRAGGRLLFDRAELDAWVRGDV